MTSPTDPVRYEFDAIKHVLRNLRTFSGQNKSLVDLALTMTSQFPPDVDTKYWAKKFNALRIYLLLDPSMVPEDETELRCFRLVLEKIKTLSQPLYENEEGSESESDVGMERVENVETLEPERVERNSRAGKVDKKRNSRHRPHPYGSVRKMKKHNKGKKVAEVTHVTDVVEGPSSSSEAPTTQTTTQALIDQVDALMDEEISRLVNEESMDKNEEMEDEGEDEDEESLEQPTVITKSSYVERVM